MDRDEPVPEADAIEQSEGPDGPSAPSDLPRDVGEKPEADALEQSQTVQEVRVRVVPPGHDDVPEADWLEQSVSEPFDEDDLR